MEKLADDVVSQFHDPECSNQTEVGYHLAWARTYLRKYGILENSARGIWSLTSRAKEVKEVDPQDVVRTVRAADRKGESEESSEAPPEVSAELQWQEKLHLVLTRKITPAAFERLIQRLLRESGFTQVAAAQHSL